MSQSDPAGNFFVGQVLLDDGVSLLSRNENSRQRRRSHICYIGNGRGKKRTSLIPGKLRKSSKRTSFRKFSPGPDSGTSQVGDAVILTEDLRLAASMEGPDDVRNGRTWTERQNVENENWGNFRVSAFEGFVSSYAVPNTVTCTLCGNLASVACWSCSSAYLCHVCDEAQHTLQPFHKRRHWSAGFWQSLSPTATVTANGDFIPIAPVLPLHGSRHACASCQTEMAIKQSESAVIVIGPQGRFELRFPFWRCPACSHSLEVSKADLMRCGYFVASPVQMSTVVHEDVFVMWKELRFRSPGTSLRAFLRMFEKLGSSYGTVAPIDLQRFEKAYSEWGNMEFELQKMVGTDFMSCEACGPEPSCVHIDGNFKLYRYRSSGDNRMTTAYHRGTFLHDNKDVDSHAAKLAPITKTTNRCGTSLWAAARNSTGLPSSKRTQDETGVVAATCRHSVVLGGVNMYRGEQFAYGHYLHQTLFKNVCFFASDVVCKYWPWAQRVASVWPEYSLGDTQPFLSVMHAAGHAYYCQIRFGGFWQPGSGWSVMETTEIANAFLSRAANTTKYMTSAQRVDSLTDLVLSYNGDKHRHMPDLLLGKMAAATRRISELAQEQQALLEKHDMAVEDIAGLVEELKLLATSLSSRDLQSDGGDLCNAIELVSDSLRVRKASISRLADSSKRRAKLRRLVASDKKKLDRLLSRYSQATGVHIDARSCEDGHFPWHEELCMSGPLSLSEKRALCDIHMKFCRAQEEKDLVTREMQRLLTYGSYVVVVLAKKLEWIDYQLSVPAAERLPLLEFGNNCREKYCIRNQSEGVLRGLQGIVRTAIDLRRRYGEAAYLLLSEYVEASPDVGSQSSPANDCDLRMTA